MVTCDRNCAFRQMSIPTVHDTRSGKSTKPHVCSVKNDDPKLFSKKTRRKRSQLLRLVIYFVTVAGIAHHYQQHSFTCSGVIEFETSKDWNVGLLKARDYLVLDKAAQNLQQYYVDIDILRSLRRKNTFTVTGTTCVYVPLYSGLHYHLCDEPIDGTKTSNALNHSRTHCRDLNELVYEVTQSSLWRKHGGLNFIWPHTHVYAFNALNKQNKRAVGKGMLLSVEPEWFRKHIPTSKRDCIIPYSVLSRNLPDGVSFDVNRQRNRHICFGGRNSTLIRSNILSAMQSFPDRTYIMHNETRDAYLDALFDCNFCPVPDGDVKSTVRLYEALVTGCIPVLMSPGVRLPFTQTIKWTDIVVDARKQADAKRLISYLFTFTEETISKIRENISEIGPANRFGMRNPLNRTYVVTDAYVGDFVLKDCLAT